MKRLGVCGALTLIVASVYAALPAGATTARPAAVLATLTVTTKVQNQGQGTAGPDSFVYHVYDDNDGTEAASGIWNPNGKTVIKLPAGTYSIFEDPLAPYSEDVSTCASITVSVAVPAACTVTNLWTFATIMVSTIVDNAGGGTAKPSSFRYRVLDANDGSEVKSGSFNAGGTTKIQVPDGTYTITEVQLEGYVEDFSQCADLTVDYQNAGACIVNNEFDPHSTTTISSTTLPGSTQVKIHGSTTTSTSCLLTLEPALQDPSTTKITVTLAGDAFPQPHKGDAITLSRTSVSIKTPADMIQTGVDLGIIKDGDKIPEKVTLVVDGDGTDERSHTYTFTVTLTIVVMSGNAQPLVASASLPDTTWTPRNDMDPVFFSQRSVQLKSTITSAAIGGAVTSTFSCSTPNAAPFLALAAQPGQVPTSTPGGGGDGGVVNGGGTTGASVPGSETLPRTGTSTWLWLVLAIALLDLGLLAIGATARGRRRVLNR